MRGAWITVTVRKYSLQPGVKIPANLERRMMLPYRVSVDGVEVEPEYIGPGPSLEELKAHYAAQRLRDELQSRARGGVVGWSPLHFAALVFTAAAVNDVNPVRVTLRFDGVRVTNPWDRFLASFLINRLWDAFDLLERYVLDRIIWPNLIDELAKKLREARVNGKPGELEWYSSRLAITVNGLLEDAVKARDYIALIFGFTPQNNQDIISLLDEAAEKAGNPHARKLADHLREAAKACYELAYNLTEYIRDKLTPTRDPDELTANLEALRKTISTYMEKIRTELREAKEVLRTLEEESILLPRAYEDSELAPLKV